MLTPLESVLIHRYQDARVEFAETGTAEARRDYVQAEGDLGRELALRGDAEDDGRHYAGWFDSDEGRWRVRVTKFRTPVGRYYWALPENSTRAA